MAKYTQKPPVVDALQFTGGAASARAIIEGLASLAPQYTVRFLPASSEFGMGPAGGVVETKFTERIRIEDTNGADMTASVNDWVMVDRDKTARVLTNAEFTAQYQTV